MVLVFVFRLAGLDFCLERKKVASRCFVLEVVYELRLLLCARADVYCFPSGSRDRSKNKHSSSNLRQLRTSLTHSLTHSRNSLCRAQPRKTTSHALELIYLLLK